MPEVVTAVIIATLAFAATNLDILILLVAVMASPDVRKLPVSLGFLCAMAVVVAISLGLGVTLAQLEPGQLRWLGLVPLAVGVFMGGRLLLKGQRGEDRSPSSSAVFWTTLVLTFVHSVDSLVVYGPLFAETKQSNLVAMLCTISILAFGAIFLAVWLTTHPKLRSILQKAAPVAIPVLLILIGTYILLDTPTDIE